MCLQIEGKFNISPCELIPWSFMLL